jgi:hypothetical protein
MRSVLLAVVAACLLFAASQAKSQQRDCYSQFPGAAQRARPHAPPVLKSFSSPRTEALALEFW